MNFLFKAKKTVSKGLSKDNAVTVADKMLTGIEKVENVVIGRSSSHGSSRHSRTSGRRGGRLSNNSNSSSGSSRRNKASRRRSSRAEQEEMMVYCSDMYSEDFVKAEMKRAADSKAINRLVLEDLVARDQDTLSTATREFLLSTAMLAESGSSHNRNNKKMMAREDKASGNVRRGWESITFTDCISDAEDYRAYLEKKQKFMSGLNRMMAMKRVNVVLPLRFVAKLEIHSMLPLFSITELLQEVERDADNIKLVRFPGFKGSEDEIAAEFASMVDPETLEWTGPLVEIHLRYDKEDITMMEIRAKKDGKKPMATLRACVEALEKVCLGDDDIDSLACDSEDGFVASFPPMDGGNVTKPPAMRDESATERSMFESDSGLPGCRRRDVPKEEIQVRKLAIR